MTNKDFPLKAALCEFKKNKVTIVKGKVNPFHKSKYADISDILSAIEEGLSDLGVIVMSKSFYNDGAWVLRTQIEHKDSDEFMCSDFPLFGGKPQEFGSSITYARRYNMQSLLNLAAEDDDGNASNSAKPVKQGAPKQDPHKAAREYLVKAKAQMTACKTHQELTDWETANSKTIDRLCSYEDLAKEYAKHYGEVLVEVQS